MLDVMVIEQSFSALALLTFGQIGNNFLKFVTLKKLKKKKFLPKKFQAAGGG